MTENHVSVEPDLIAALRESLFDRGHVVEDWPADEAAAYRENGRFLEGAAAADEIRFAKAARAVMAVLAPAISAAVRQARSGGLQDAADIVHARIRDREQPFTIQTEDGSVTSGVGPAWAVPDLQLVEQVIRQRAVQAQQATPPVSLLPTSTPEGKP